jgi:hypothetical protein
MHLQQWPLRLLKVQLIMARQFDQAFCGGQPLLKQPVSNVQDVAGRTVHLLALFQDVLCSSVVMLVTSARLAVNLFRDCTCVCLVQFLRFFG